MKVRSALPSLTRASPRLGTIQTVPKVFKGLDADMTGVYDVQQDTARLISRIPRLDVCPCSDSLPSWMCDYDYR